MCFIYQKPIRSVQFSSYHTYHTPYHTTYHTIPLGRAYRLGPSRPRTCAFTNIYHTISYHAIPYHPQHSLLSIIVLRPFGVGHGRSQELTTSPFFFLPLFFCLADGKPSLAFRPHCRHRHCAHHRSYSVTDTALVLEPERRLTLLSKYKTEPSDSLL